MRKAANVTKCRRITISKLYLDAYIKAAGIGDDGKSPLFRSAVGRTDTLTEKPMNRALTPGVWFSAAPPISAREFGPSPRIQAWKTGSGAKSPFSTAVVSWQPIHVAAMVA